MKYCVIACSLLSMINVHAVLVNLSDKKTLNDRLSNAGFDYFNEKTKIVISLPVNKKKL